MLNVGSIFSPFRVAYLYWGNYYTDYIKTVNEVQNTMKQASSVKVNENWVRMHTHKKIGYLYRIGASMYISDKVKGGAILLRSLIHTSKQTQYKFNRL